MTNSTSTNELTREKTRLADRALAESRAGEWEESIATNRELLTLDPQDVVALNRLGRSLAKLGRLREAADAYRRAAEADPANGIAARNLARLTQLLEQVQSNTIEPVPTESAAGDRFIMEAGRSAVLRIEELASPAELATVMPGDVLEVRAEGPYLRLYAGNGVRIGTVPADRAHRVIELMQAGNRYSAIVAAASVEGVHVLLQETYQSPQAHGKLAFPPTKRVPAADRVPIVREPTLGVADPEDGQDTDLLDDEDAEVASESDAESLTESDTFDDTEE